MKGGTYGPVGRLNVLFLNLRGSAVKPNDVITLRFEADDSRHYEIDLHAGCAAITIAGLSRLLGELKPKQAQPIVVNAVQAAVFGDGTPSISLELEGGGELVVQLKSGIVSQLIDALRNIAAPPGSSQH